MQAIDLELFVLQIADHVLAGRRIEDSRVELKREWPNPDEHTARRLAGHCNAARSPWVVWIIGLGENGDRGDIDTMEPHQWMSKLTRYFDEISPTPQLSIRVTHAGKPVTAILFGSDRSPYVWINPQFGQQKGAVHREVPWRELTSVRSAKREDLIRLLSPHRTVPYVEVLSGSLHARRDKEMPIWRWQGHLHLYVTTLDGRGAVFPRHKMRVEVTDSSKKELVKAYAQIDSNPHWHGPNSNVLLGPDEVVVNQCGAFRLILHCDPVPPEEESPRPDRIIMTLSLGVQPDLVVSTLQWEWTRRSHDDLASQWY